MKFAVLTTLNLDLAILFIFLLWQENLLSSFPHDGRIWLTFFG